MLDDVLRWLRCPVCEGTLARAPGAVRCAAGHSFDIARQGYVSLLPPGTPGGRGDTAAMVAARREFLAAGHFAPIAAALASAAAEAGTAGLAAGRAPGQAAGQAQPGCVADVGAGTGYYLAAVLDRLPAHPGLALDLSRYALRAAARAHPRIGAAACDAWRRLPVADAAAAVVLNVFAPRDGTELRRILRPDGHLLVVAPAPEHLAELTRPLGLLRVDERKAERLEGTLGPFFALAAEHHLRQVMSLDHRSVAALAAMGPSAWHAKSGEMPRRVAALPDLVPVTMAVTVSVWRPRPPPR